MASQFTNPAVLNQCAYCALWHYGVCPRVKHIEYYEDGRIKSVELYEHGVLPSDKQGVK